MRRRPTTTSIERRGVRRSSAGLALLTCALASVVVATPWDVSAISASERQRSKLLAQQAKRLYVEGKPALAEELFRQAFALDPDPGLLYSAARSAEIIGKLHRARRDFKRVLAMTKPGDLFHRKSLARLKVIKRAAPPAAPPVSAGTRARARGGAKPTTTAPPPRPATGPKTTRPALAPASKALASKALASKAKTSKAQAAPSQNPAITTHGGAADTSSSHLAPASVGVHKAEKPGGWQRPAALGAWSVAAIGLVSGAVLGGLWWKEDADLASYRNADGKYVGIALDDVQQRTISNNRRSLTAGIAAGVGAAAAGVGTWLWWRAQGKSTTTAQRTPAVSAWWSPTPDGGGHAALLVRF